MSGRLEPDPRARPPPSRWGGVCAPSFRYQGQGAVPPTPPPPPNASDGTRYIYLGRYIRDHKQRRTEFRAELSRR